MSSFRRAGAVDTGTRPGLHGQTLISMGLVDLDRLLGGGLPLASVLLLLEDPCSGQHLNMVRYFMAEGVKCRQRVRWLSPSPPPGGPGAFLPAEASPSQSSGAAAEEAAAEQPQLRIAWQYAKYETSPHGWPHGGTGGPGGGGASAGSSSRSSGAGSTSSSSSSASRAVAAGVGREWCHSYDLTRPMGQEALQGADMEVLPCSGSGAYGNADRLAGEFLTSLAAAPEPQPGQAAGPGPGAPGPSAAAAGTAARRPGSAGRLVIESAGSLGWTGSGGDGDSGSDRRAEQSLLRLLYNVRQRVQQSRCAVLVTVPAGLLSPSCAARLPHLADTVLALEGLADDMRLHRLLPDPASAVALLSVRKLCAAGMVGPRQPDGGQQLYVVRHKRRRLGLSPVEVDPDAEDRMAEAVARAAEVYGSKTGGGGSSGGSGVGGGVMAGGKSSAAAVLCGGPQARDNKALDF